MKKIVLSIILVIASNLMFAQSFELRDHNDLLMLANDNEFRASGAPLSETKFHVRNATTNPITFGVKMYEISNPTLSEWQVCFGVNCFIANDGDPSQQIFLSQSVAGCDTYTGLKIAPFAFGWQYGDEGTWRITVYDIANPNDSVSSIVTWKYTLAGDINSNELYDIGEISGDVDESGVIDANEIAGDIDGDYVMWSSGEFIGDVNGNGILDAGEKTGDNDGDGTIAGDTNGDGVIGSGEISGDINNNGTIGAGEVAGDNSGDGVINSGEIAGDNSGDMIIGGGEVAGDLSGNGSIDGAELAGDSDGSGTINGAEFLGNVNGDYFHVSSEIYGDSNGNGIIDGAEVLGDINNDGVVTLCEVGYTAIDEQLIDDMQIKIFPNPAIDFVQVRYEQDEKQNEYLLDIYDVLGQKIRREELDINSNHLVVNTSSYTAGVYFFIIRESKNENILKSERIVVK